LYQYQCFNLVITYPDLNFSGTGGGSAGLAFRAS